MDDVSQSARLLHIKRNETVPALKTRDERDLKAISSNPKGCKDSTISVDKRLLCEGGT